MFVHVVSVDAVKMGEDSMVWRCGGLWQMETLRPTDADREEETHIRDRLLDLLESGRLEFRLHKTLHRARLLTDHTKT